MLGFWLRRIVGLALLYVTAMAIFVLVATHSRFDLGLAYLAIAAIPHEGLLRYVVCEAEAGAVARRALHKLKSDSTVMAIVRDPAAGFDVRAEAARRLAASDEAALVEAFRSPASDPGLRKVLGAVLSDERLRGFVVETTLPPEARLAAVQARLHKIPRLIGRSAERRRVLGDCQQDLLFEVFSRAAADRELRGDTAALLTREDLILRALETTARDDSAATVLVGNVAAQDVLEKIALDDRYREGPRRAALFRLDDEDLLLGFPESDGSLRMVAHERLGKLVGARGPAHCARVATQDSRSGMRSIAVWCVTEKRTLKAIAARDPSLEVRQAAERRLEDLNRPPVRPRRAVARFYERSPERPVHLWHDPPGNHGPNLSVSSAPP